MKPLNLLVLLLVLSLLASCALDRIAVNMVADTLSAPGSNTVFTGDDDPVLIGDALPFAIKFYESAAAMAPDHMRMKLMVGSLYVMYANAFVQTPLERLSPGDFDIREAGLDRAKRLYLRGAAYVEPVLERRFPGFGKAFRGTGMTAVLSRAEPGDAATLYWYVAAWLGAASTDSLDAEIAVRLPALGLLLERALALDPDFNKGALHELAMLYFSSMPPGLGFDEARAALHYEAALKASGGQGASAHVARAETWALKRQDRKSFVQLLDKALAVDPRKDPDTTLVNVMAQDRARFLGQKLDELFWNEEVSE